MARGYTVRGDSKSFEILDAANKVVARSGTPMIIGGGGADNFQDTWTGRDCATNGHLWMVGTISTPDSNRLEFARSRRGGCSARQIAGRASTLTAWAW